tara:strand:+ start:3912 stop:4088 length:177 start_codon:yes stop_codon:yes gene_type:complete
MLNFETRLMVCCKIATAITTKVTTKVTTDIATITATTIVKILGQSSISGSSNNKRGGG